MNFKQFSPCFLIAMPELEDEHFARTVVLLTQYDQKGAFGLVINRETQLHFGTSIILSQGALNPHYLDQNLWYGGPVSPEQIWMVYDQKFFQNPKDTHLGQDIMFTQDISILLNHEVNIDTHYLRAFHGCSGWGAKQLEAELAISSWITCPLSKTLLFDTPKEKIWEAAIQELGIDPRKLVTPKSMFLN